VAKHKLRCSQSNRTSTTLITIYINGGFIITNNRLAYPVKI
jgi:hypothetical protein